MSSRKYFSIITVSALAVLSTVVVVVSILYLLGILKYDSYNEKDFIDSDTYQAVFLTNDQIYFGHLSNINSDYLILYDVYYVRVGENDVGQIIKLGMFEPHGPRDKMIINQEHILFWENLKFDSKVVETIRNVKLQEK